MRDVESCRERRMVQLAGPARGNPIVEEIDQQRRAAVYISDDVEAPYGLPTIRTR